MVRNECSHRRQSLRGLGSPFAFVAQMAPGSAGAPKFGFGCRIGMNSAAPK